MMRLDPSKPLNEQILRAARRTRPPAPTPAPPTTSGPAPVDNGAGARPSPLPLLTTSEQFTAWLLRAAGRLPRW